MKILNLEKIVPDEGARKELFEQHMMETTLRLNAPRIIRELDNVCDSKRTADRIWKIIWMDVRSGKVKDYGAFQKVFPGEFDAYVVYGDIMNKLLEEISDKMGALWND